MSAVTTVPERYGPTDEGAFHGEDVFEEVGPVGLFRVVLNAIQRFRDADAMSYSRALGFSSVVTLVPALIALVGLATTVDSDPMRAVLRDTFPTFAPGPAGTILTEALQATSKDTTALIAGLAGMLVAGTIGMVEMERAANNLYGVRVDRPVIRRYGLGFVLAATVSVFLMLGLVVIAAGGAVGDAAVSAGLLSGWARTVWSVLRWPIGVLLVAIAMTLIFRLVPNRRQPPFSWLMSGATVAVVLWVGVTLLLALFYEHAATLGHTYGPLLGIVALLLWAHFSAVAVLFGLAFAAELEARQANRTRRMNGNGR
jgi:YihY family inner membrane protein